MSTKIGRFEILGDLAKSDWGSVYKASDPESGQTVALKTYRLDVFGEQAEEVVQRILQEVRENGAWEAWMEYFLTGVRDTAAQAVETAREILALFDEDRGTIQTLGRGAASAFRVHHLMQRRPLITIQAASKELKLSLPTVGKSLEHLVDLGIMHEVTGRQRRRVFAYRKYLDVLDRGTEPLPP